MEGSVRVCVCVRSRARSCVYEEYFGIGGAVSAIRICVCIYVCSKPLHGGGGGNCYRKFVIRYRLSGYAVEKSEEGRKIEISFTVR